MAATADRGTVLRADQLRGIARTFGKERGMPTWLSCVAEVAADRASGIVTMAKLTIVTDAGTIIDRDSATAQTEGAAFWGLSMALFEGTEFVAGEVRGTNLNTCTLVRISDLPTLDIRFVAGDEVPMGLGEPATTVIAPAIANAIFAAAGARATHNPINPASVPAALAQARP